MKISDLIVPLGLAIVTTWAIHYFFLGTYQWGSGEQVEQSFIAPKTKQEYRPLNKEIDFIDIKRPKRAVISEVETAWGHATFSSDGATLESIDFKRMLNGKEQLIRTIFPVPEIERESRCFLVALQEKTPYFYTLASRKDGDEVTELTYKADFNQGSIHKTFNIYTNKHQIDLKLEVHPKKDLEHGLELRIFYPSPIMPAIEQSDVISSVVIDQKQSFEKTKLDSLDEQRGWFTPTFFGGDSRYFVHALVQDADNFVRRAYYKKTGSQKLFSILEGPMVQESQSWTMSFYFGPKEAEAISAVDQRLEKTFDYYGWFAPIAKVLLMILKWFYQHLHNYGLAIIALTILVRLLLLPVTMHGEQRMKQQREFQKKIAHLQRRYKDDSQRFSQERAELIRKHGMPGIGGCLLPMLLQIPIFFSLSRVLASSIELYQAPMLWISDLSARDPYYVFPVLVVMGMILQSAGGDPKQRISSIGMALLFGAFTASFSAGLALYICVSSLLHALQTWLLKYFKLAR